MQPTQPPPTTATPLALSVDPIARRCVALPYGMPLSRLDAVRTSEEVEIATDGRTALGFAAELPRHRDLIGPLPEPWCGVHFDVPSLFCEPAPADHLLAIAGSLFGEHGTPDVVFAHAARSYAETDALDLALESATWSLAAGSDGALPRRTRSCAVTARASPMTLGRGCC